LRNVVAGLVGIASAVGSARVSAEGAGIGVRYRAPSGCPTEAEFLQEVRQRSPRVEAAPAVDSAQLVVTIAEESVPRYRGRLERATPQGNAGVREITGESCLDVAKALALITALTADLVSPAPTPAESPKPTANAETKVDRATPPVAAREVDVPAPTPTGVRGVPRGRWQVGLEGLVASGVTPNPLAGFTVFGEIDGRSSAFWVPGVRLSASLGVSSWSAPDATDPAEAHFAWMVASLDGCPFQIGDPLDLSVQPCARVTGGWLRSAGGGRANSHVRYPAWGDAGAVVRVHWQVARAFFFDADAEAFVPWFHYVFDFDFPPNNTEVANNVGFRFGAGIGVLFR
jgi:hypothetical protein